MFITNFLHRNLLRINDLNEGLLCLLCPTMPQGIRITLLDTLLGIFPEDLTIVDTKKNPFKPYASLHCVWYNRYSVHVCFTLSSSLHQPNQLQGDGKSSDQLPQNIQRPGVKTANTCQYIPRMSKETEEHSEVYMQSKQALLPVFTWIHGIVSFYLFFL